MLIFRSCFVSTFGLALMRRLVPVSKSYHRRRSGELMSTPSTRRGCVCRLRRERLRTPYFCLITWLWVVFNFSQKKKSKKAGFCMHKSPQRGPKSISHRQLMAAQGLLASRGHQDLSFPTTVSLILEPAYGRSRPQQPRRCRRTPISLLPPAC